MLGVVLWSDAADRKAVIWCEDQGDLAYVNASETVLKSGDFFDAGDLIQFDMEMCKSMRKANNPRLVIEKAGSELPEALRQNTQRQSEAIEIGNVIHLDGRRRTQSAPQPRLYKGA